MQGSQIITNSASYGENSILRQIQVKFEERSRLRNLLSFLDELNCIHINFFLREAQQGTLGIVDSLEVSTGDCCRFCEWEQLYMKRLHQATTLTNWEKEEYFSNKLLSFITEILRIGCWFQLWIIYGRLCRENWPL